MAPLIHKEIDSLLGGVSQQPPELRLDSQVESSVNTLLDPTSGALKRPPLLHRGVLDTVYSRETNSHPIVRDEQEQYLVNIEAGVAGASHTELSVIDPISQSTVPLVYLDRGDKKARSPFTIVAWFGGSRGSGVGDPTSYNGNYHILLESRIDGVDTRVGLAVGLQISPPTTITIAGVGLDYRGDDIGAQLNGTHNVIGTPTLKSTFYGNGAYAHSSDYPHGIGGNWSTDISEYDTTELGGTTRYYHEIELDLGVGISTPATAAYTPEWLTDPNKGHISEIDGTSLSIYPNELRSDAEKYIENVATPNKSIRMLTIADTTFVVNRLVTVEESVTTNSPGYETACISSSGGAMQAGPAYASMEIAGYDADNSDDPDEAPRWAVDILSVSGTPGTTAATEQDGLQIKKIKDALAVAPAVFLQASFDWSLAWVNVLAISSANPAVVTTSPNHNLIEGQAVYFQNVFSPDFFAAGLDTPYVTSNTNPQFYAQNVTSNTFEVVETFVGPLDSTGFTTFASTSTQCVGLGPPDSGTGDFALPSGVKDTYDHIERLEWTADTGSVANYKGLNGWIWEYSGGDPIHTELPNFIIGTYYSTVIRHLHFPPYSTSKKIDVPIPNRERLEFTRGSENTVITHSWRGPSDVSKLPAVCQDGFKTRIVGDPDVEADEYYLQYSALDGVWVESISSRSVKHADTRGQIRNHFDVRTMPHVLKRKIATGDPEEDYTLVLSAGDIYFTFGPEDWAPRQVGDDVMAPTPSFVGQPLNDIVLYKDRLAFLSRDSVMFSEVREPLNFWPTSIMTSVDSDPIDVQASTTTDGASDFHSGVATEAGLLLLTSSGQFLARPSLGEGFTPKTVHIDQVSRYQSENASKPIFVGSRVYWVTEQGANSKVWEYRVFSDASGDAPVGSATEITNHAPRFLPKNIYKVTANDNESIICFLSSDEPTSVYVYQYLLSGNDRLQSAWSKWTTDQPIINGNFLNRNLNLLLDRTETISGPQTVLEYMPPRLSDPNLSDSPVTDMPVCLDQRVQYTILSAANPSGLHVGTFKEILLPMPAPRDPLDVDKVHPDLQVLVGGSGSLAGTLILASSISVESNSQEPNSIFVEIEDSVFNEPLFIGKRYVQDIELSTCIIKSSATRTSAPRPYTDGRLQLRTFSIKFSKSGPFTVYVNNGGTVYSYNYYDPWVLGDPFGPGSKSHGEFKVDVGGRNTETSLQLVNDSPFLSVFIGARYEASWSTRSKRM